MCMDTAIIDQAVRIDKSTPLRVIIPALQIVQPRFRVVDVSAVAQGVLCAEGGGHRTGGAQRIAPCVVGVGHNARAAGIDEAGHVALCVLDVEVLRAVAVHGQRTGRVVGEAQLIAAPRQLHQLVAQIMVIIGRAVDGLRDALAAVIVGIRPRLPRRLIVLAHELVEAVVGVGRRALAVGDGRDVPARVVGVGIRRRAGLPRPDLPRGRRGRGIVVADRGLDHGLPAILRVHRGHPTQRVVGVARGDGSLRRFRQAVVLIVGIACSMATT